jgi:lipopolysaccharide export system protein LptA
MPRCPGPAAIAARSAIALLLWVVAPPAHPERADRYRPTQVDADRLTYDDVKQESVFSGSVVLTKGTITLRADRLVLQQDPEGYQRGTATGKLATFRQKRDGVDEWVEGQGEEIVYDGKAETVRLSRGAKVRRLEGSRVVDEIDGAVITYDSRTEQFSVDGGSAQGPAAAAGGGRVRVVIQPRLGDAAAPASGGGPAGGGNTSGSAAPPALRPAAPR